MSKKIFILILLVLVTVVFLVVQNKYKNPKKQQSTIKVGAILMLSGVGADYGENSHKGIDLAVKEINDSGGVLGKKIEMVYQDNQGDNPQAAVNAYKVLRAQGIKFIIGPNWTPSAQALLPIIDQDQALVISPSVGIAEFA